MAKIVQVLAVLFFVVLVAAAFKLGKKRVHDSDLPSDKKTTCSIFITKEPEVKIVVIDSCEYLKCPAAYGYFTYTHKGNCKYCATRNK